MAEVFVLLLHFVPRSSTFVSIIFPSPAKQCIGSTQHILIRISCSIWKQPRYKSIKYVGENELPLSIRKHRECAHNLIHSLFISGIESTMIFVSGFIFFVCKIFETNGKHKKNISFFCICVNEWLFTLMRLNWVHKVPNQVWML